MKKVKVGIIGHTGRLGKPLKKLLGKHPFAEIVYTESRSKGKWGNLSNAEMVFLALHPGKSKTYIPRLNGKRVIDLSIDYRNSRDWVYGLSEIFGTEIKRATRVANPGCYATSILLGLYPLKGKIEEIFIASTSGISGAGLEISKEDNFLIYKAGTQHSQIQEIKRVMGLKSIVFVPQRIDTAECGIVSTMFIRTGDLENLADLYCKAYKKHPFVRVITDPKNDIESKNVIGTNFCDIKVLKCGKQAVIVSALDNLMKGGASQAVQNFNLMCGFKETLALLR
ncbi:MAG: hypothetical protein A3J76_01935 [Candidatus Moranbacteria bacterium RBG_13_45_13]|nr:MAG: hypothetical protein A3J76_01935 [Candidatus Moranbacteria bacterium RBG_13_45_13]